MNIINSKLVAFGAVCLLSACGVPDQAAKVQDQVQALGGTQELLGMTKGVNQTLKAVKSGDFDTAKQEFSSVQQSWTEASTQLKASPEKISSIKGNLQTIATDLQSGSPDKAKLVTNLQTLSGSLGSLAKGEDGTETAANPDNPTETASNPDTTTETAANTDTTTETAADTEDGTETAANVTTAEDTTETAVNPEEAPIGGVEVPVSTDTSQAFNDNLLAMQDALAKTNTAVEANDFSTAKTSFSEARQTWYQFGGVVKDKSAESYQTLDQGVKTVNTALNGAEPSQDALLTDLQAMSTELDAVAK